MENFREIRFPMDLLDAFVRDGIASVEEHVINDPVDKEDSIEGFSAKSSIEKVMELIK